MGFVKVFLVELVVCSTCYFSIEIASFANKKNAVLNNIQNLCPSIETPETSFHVLCTEAFTRPFTTTMLQYSVYLCKLEDMPRLTNGQVLSSQPVDLETALFALLGKEGSLSSMGVDLRSN